MSKKLQPSFAEYVSSIPFYLLGVVLGLAVFIPIFSLALALSPLCFIPIGIRALWAWRPLFSNDKTVSYPFLYEYKPALSILNKVTYGLVMCIKIITFPLYAYWTGLRTVIGQLIYPEGLNGENTDTIPRSYSSYIQMADGRRLFTLTFHPQDQLQEDGDIVSRGEDSLPPEKHRYVIFSGGHGTTYRDYLPLMEKLAHTQDASVYTIGFDYSSFGLSGRIINDQIHHLPMLSQDIAIEELSAQVQRLLDKGIDPSKITLYGHSLGGAIATLTAARFPGIKLYNDRSFSSISAVLKGWLLPGNPDYPPNTVKGRIVYALKTGCISPVIAVGSVILKLVNWNCNAGAAFAKIEAERREYTVIRHKLSQADWTATAHINDEVIPYYASIHRIPELKAARSATKATRGVPRSHKFFHNPTDGSRSTLDGEAPKLSNFFHNNTEAWLHSIALTELSSLHQGSRPRSALGVLQKLVLVDEAADEAASSPPM
jgi:pimeloyl-ACP methyl ester carboxylesterase